MTALQLTLFGSPQVLVSGAPVALRNKARAVLFCLAATESPLSRRVLAGRLWSEQPSDLVALERLRGEVHALRRVLPAGVLEISAESLGLNHQVVTSDLALFNAATSRAQPSLAECEQALHAYAGPFLDGFELELKGRTAMSSGYWRSAGTGRRRGCASCTRQPSAPSTNRTPTRWGWIAAAAFSPCIPTTNLSTGCS